MNLSEAIRLGTMLRPRQAYGRYWDGPDAACALGAVAAACGLPELNKTLLNALRPRYPILNRRLVPSCCGCSDGQVLSMSVFIVHLNDVHYWTRERIADWVETLEHDTVNEPTALTVHA